VTGANHNVSPAIKAIKFNAEHITIVIRQCCSYIHKIENVPTDGHGALGEGLACAAQAQGNTFY